MEAAFDIRKAAADSIGAKFSTLDSKLFGILIGEEMSWLVFLRRKAKALGRLASKHSVEVLCQSQHIHPVPIGDRFSFMLLFRHLCPKLSVNHFSDNLAARKEAHRLAKVASLNLERFAKRGWCRRSALCGKLWHWFCVVVLHPIVRIWKPGKNQYRVGAFAKSDGPLVDDQAGHRRLRSISVGIDQPEIPIVRWCEIAWASHAKQLGHMGLKLEIGEDHPAAPLPETLDPAKPR